MTQLIKYVFGAKYFVTIDMFIYHEWTNFQ